MTAWVKPGYNKQATLLATGLKKKKNHCFQCFSFSSQLQFWEIILRPQRQKEKKSYLKFLFDATVTGVRYETLQFRIKMRFCYGYTNECQNDTYCHMISLPGPLSSYYKTVPADFNSETRNPVALQIPWSGSTGQVYVQFK